MDNPANWRLSNAPKLSVTEAVRLLRPDRLTPEEHEKLRGRYFYPTVTMGMDPEFFLADDKGLILPAFQILAHKKENPHLFWDGFQAECTVQARACHQELAQQLAGALRRIGSRYRIVASPVWRVPQAFLQTAEEDHVRLGCDPSYNVYNMKGLHVEDGRKLPWRFAGGHVHFELPQAWKIPPRVKSIIRTLDAICATACVCFAAGVDRPIRRQS
jgi:hypothetical protein